ncbi:MAG: phosphatase PAP2 family protein [Crenarchaeota archaeon]|nr:phosphatase PAP2 family protein [Thermoproteota archaeon]MCR8472428.1 phosphatase PAP2 family protein [Thermoproteota archaeon]MCR8473554.1 phosphatase PAP2 family protein [Thermoproteota archaeon]MCR8488889.1 phosphatase PAP2 family protein [Thermoproteota archaeon]
MIMLLSLALIPLDVEIIQAVVSLRTPLVNWFMIYYTTYGNYIFALIEGLILIFSRKRNYRDILYLVLNSYAGWFIADRIVESLKNIVRRPRPYVLFNSIEPLVKSDGFSFPSGHSSAAWALALPFMMVINSHKVKFTLVLFATLISFSRVYCGVHFLSDVIFGGCIGYVISKSIFENVVAKQLEARDRLQQY